MQSVGPKQGHRARAKRYYRGRPGSGVDRGSGHLRGQPGPPVSTPALYGVTWNAGLDDQFGALSRAQVLAATRQLAGVTGVAAGAYGGDVSIDGVYGPCSRDRQPEGVCCSRRS